MKCEEKKKKNKEEEEEEEKEKKNQEEEGENKEERVGGGDAGKLKSDWIFAVNPLSWRYYFQSKIDSWEFCGLH